MFPEAEEPLLAVFGTHLPDLSPPTFSIII